MVAVENSWGRRRVAARRWTAGRSRRRFRASFAAGALGAEQLNSAALAAIPLAWRRRTAVTHGAGTLTSGGSLENPLGMALAPDGDVITVNGGNGDAVETTPAGQQVASVKIDPAGAGGDLFGLAIAPHGHGVVFVDDGDNTLKLCH
jgi:hypothetical protein